MHLMWSAVECCGLAIHFLFEIFKQANNDIAMRIDEALARIRYQIFARFTFMIWYTFQM